MKLKEIQMSPATMQAMAESLVFRSKNMADMTKRGQPASESILADLTVMEAKLDAVLMILEEGGFDFSKIDHFMERAFRMQVHAIESLREQLGLDPKRPKGQA